MPLPPPPPSMPKVGVGGSSKLTHAVAAGKQGHIQPRGVGSFVPTTCLGKECPAGCSSAGPAHPRVLRVHGV